MAGNARPPIDDGAVLITGASAGIGRELSRRQAARSATRIRRTADDDAHRDRPGGQAGA